MNVSVEQLTTTPVTLPAPTTPVPPLTMQLWAGPVGCVMIVTLKALPLATGVAKVNAPSALMVRLSVSLFWRTRPVPDRPVTFPPTVNAPVTHLTATFVTFAVALPEPFDTVHVCVGPEGWVLIVTA